MEVPSFLQCHWRAPDRDGGQCAACRSSLEPVAAQQNLKGTVRQVGAVRAIPHSPCLACCSAALLPALALLQCWSLRCCTPLLGGQSNPRQHEKKGQVQMRRTRGSLSKVLLDYSTLTTTVDGIGAGPLVSAIRIIRPPSFSPLPIVRPHPCHCDGHCWQASGRLLGSQDLGRKKEDGKAVEDGLLPAPSG